MITGFEQHRKQPPLSPLSFLRKSMTERQVFLSSLRDSGFLAHPFPAMNRWAIIMSPYGTKILPNTISELKSDIKYMEAGQECPAYRR